MCELTPKENYLQMLKSNIPEYMPSFFEPSKAPVEDDFLTPTYARNGPVTTSLGVVYVGSPENNYGAMPAPGSIVITDITKWRDQLKIKDISDVDWEAYYKRLSKDVDRKNKCLSVTGGDYFLTLVSLLGFEETLMAMYEEPEEVLELLSFISEFYVKVMKKQMQYLKPDIYTLLDDDSALNAPFFSVEMYRKFFKPFHKIHCDICKENGVYIARHDCGKSGQFIPDWLEIGVRDWNPCQTTNDLKKIKKEFGDKLVLSGCWGSHGEFEKKKDFNPVKARDELAEYVETFAPGGNFSFGAFAMGKPDDPVSMEKSELIKSFFFDYARNWYKTH